MDEQKKDYDEMYNARIEYAEKFGVSPPSIGLMFGISPKEYAELLRRCIQEGKKLRVRYSDTKGRVY